MKYIVKYLSLGLLCSTAGMLGNYILTTPTIEICPPVRTTWVPITIGQNLYTQYHKIIFPEGLDDCSFYNDFDECSLVYDCSATYRFTQSRNSAQIAQALWSSNNLIFQGNNTQIRDDNGLIAEYFGMGPDTNGFISLCPRLRNQVIDLQVAVSGVNFWGQINLPITYAKWSVSSQCGSPTIQGVYGTANLDGANIVLDYPVGLTSPTSIAGTVMSPDVSTPPTSTLLFDGGDEATPNNSFVGAINNGDFVNIDTNQTPNQMSVTLNINNTSVTQQAVVGYINMGLYGAFDSGGIDTGFGVTAADFMVADVSSAPNIGSALGGYKFGMVQKRDTNLFNFNPSGKWQLADIPIMLGYDFCKSDISHLGAYLKFVIPTGTKIDKCFVQYVLNPVIGNGRHFELGIGLTGHLNIWACDSTSLGVYADGYIDYMFGVCQTRTLDLSGQPMSRYALVYPLIGDQINGYEIVANTMSVVGDVNLYQGNVTATRGEFIIDTILTIDNWEVGLGYAFSGQSAESVSCNNPILETNTAYALVGSALQQTIGVGSLLGQSSSYATFNVTPYDNITLYPQSNFFYLGSTGLAAQIAEGDNAIYSYGTDVSVDDAAFVIPNTQFNSSCLMSAQVLNKLFMHIDYIWKEYELQPEIGIIGSVGFVPQGKPTANYWDLGARIGLAF